MISLTNIVKLSTGKRSDISHKIASKEINLDKPKLLQNLKVVFNTELKKCLLIEDIKQCKRAFLLAIKSVQENLNHEGQTGYFQSEQYYGEITAKGNEFFKIFTSEENLNNLKLVCYHTTSNIFNSDRKYCFFGSTNYTGTANELRDYVKTQAKVAGVEREAENLKQIETDFGQKLCDHLTGENIKEALKEIKEQGVNECRFGQIYAKKNDDNTVEVIILDEKRSYIPNRTTGGTKSIKRDNYLFTLTNPQCEFFINGLVDKVQIEQFVSVSRIERKSIEKNKQIDPNNIAKDSKGKLREKISNELLIKDGFKSIEILDSHRNKKTLYIAPYLGKKLDEVVNYSMPENDFNSLVINFLKEVLTKNLSQKIYDIKTENTLYINRKINLIDYLDSTGVTLGSVFKKQIHLLIVASRNKQKFESVLVPNQKEFLWANIVLTISKIFKLRGHNFQKFQDFINENILNEDDNLNLAQIITKEELINFRKFVQSNLNELYEKFLVLQT